MSKGFKWKGFVKPVNQSQSEMRVIVAGNFLKELVLPNALKIDSFLKLRDRLNRWFESHPGQIPDRITCTRRQLVQYEQECLRKGVRDFAHRSYATFQGIPLIPHGQ